MKTHFKLKHDETYEIVEGRCGGSCPRCVFWFDRNCAGAGNGSISYCRRGSGAYMRGPFVKIVKVTK